MGIMQSLRKKDRRGPERNAAPVSSAEATPLMMLVPDAQGIAAYQLQKFSSARAAEIFVDATLRGQVNDGTVLFWALTWQPETDSTVEPLVLIRDSDTDVVYLFSFASLSSCNDFIRYEMNRGLDLGRVMVYWAVSARVEMDFWGRAALTPSAPPRRAFVAGFVEPAKAVETKVAAEAETIVPFPQPAPEPESEPHYLTEADLADTIREMNDLLEKKEKAPPVIDFPSASRKLSKSKVARANVAAWSNFALALDEAIDVYVAELVRIRLTWNRLTRAFTEAALASRRASTRTAWQNATRALYDAASLATDQPAKMSLAWNNIGRAMARAAHAGTTIGSVRRAWMNIAWTLEEAGYAYKLEHNARVIRAWRFASVACYEAARKRIAYEAAVGLAWHNAAIAFGRAHAAYLAHNAMIEAAWAYATVQLAEAARLHEWMIRVRTGLKFAAMAIEEAIEAKAYRDELVAAWYTLSVEFLAAAREQARTERAIAAWNNAAGAFEGAHKAYISKLEQAIKDWSRFSKAVNGALEAKSRQDAVIAAWATMGGAMNDAAIAYENYAHEQRVLSGWDHATTAIIEAIVAEAKLRILQAGLDKKHVAAVDRAVKGKTARKPTKRSGKTATAQKLASSVVEVKRPKGMQGKDDDQPSEEHNEDESGEQSKPNVPGLRRPNDPERWDSKEEPFDGFRSPPGRFHHREPNTTRQI